MTQRFTLNKVLLRTFGWPMVQVPHDDFGDFEKVKPFRIEY